jgi:S1-C subfamily serine protease
MIRILLTLSMLLSGCQAVQSLIPDIRLLIVPPAISSLQAEQYFAAVEPIYTMGGMGSAFCIAADEEWVYWMTAYHVVDISTIQGVPSPTIGGRPALIFATSAENDLAVLRQPSDPTQSYVVLEFGSPSMGDRVIAPGYSRSLGREIRTLHIGWVISTDFPSLRKGWTMTHNAGGRGGNSGGPIMNSAGRVIGIASFFADLGTRNNAVNPTELCAIPGTTALAFWTQVMPHDCEDTDG